VQFWVYGSGWWQGTAAGMSCAVHSCCLKQPDMAALRSAYQQFQLGSKETATDTSNGQQWKAHLLDV
jgi:hypothetical protein